MKRTTILALALTLGMAGGGAWAQATPDDDAHHPPGAADASPGAQLPADGQKAPGGAAGMAAMMGNMMQTMGSMMQMMPQLCAAMTPGAGAAAGGMPRREMGRGMMMGGWWMDRGPLRRVEGTLAFYRAELAIGDTQRAAWEAFADAVRTAAKRLDEARQTAASAGREGSALDQLQRRATLLSAQLDALKLVQAAATPLYAGLSAEQKKTADELMTEHIARMWR
jgi:LTXXQ motif family protein